ncbi:hypothetical protein C1752_03366 [Acaryochloris thomasi RCC1774]|uniref:RRM domain-containing protein n=1 Tax=Acaryochloris thomasi RCC1774 TaxID=1764569 RepID=A0A2W1JPS5_9CYAN|nr:RNA-binding protein [Acaryochloris thomasi]PZD72892.1 hypothetical protein C1752_03366 [Acaryochloris thomasi RCC1774]
MSLFIDNLPHNATQDDLKTVFAKYGTATAIMTIRVPADEEEESEPRNCAYVTMSSNAEEEKAIAELDGTVWMGKSLKVQKVRPRRN